MGKQSVGDRTIRFHFMSEWEIDHFTSCLIYWPEGKTRRRLGYGGACLWFQQVDLCEFKGSLVSIVRSSLVGATERDPVWKRIKDRLWSQVFGIPIPALTAVRMIPCSSSSCSIEQDDRNSIRLLFHMDSWAPREGLAEGIPFRTECSTPSPFYTPFSCRSHWLQKEVSLLRSEQDTNPWARTLLLCSFRRIIASFKVLTTLTVSGMVASHAVGLKVHQRVVGYAHNIGAFYCVSVSYRRISAVDEKVYRWRMAVSSRYNRTMTW